MKKYLFVSLLIFLLAGCSGPSNDTSNIKLNKGYYYINSPIKGVQYHCGNRVDYTKENGEFNFENGVNCSFYIGDALLKSVASNKLYGGVKIYEKKISNSRVLLTVDNDGDYSKSIEIDKKAEACVEKIFNKTIPNQVSNQQINNLYQCLKDIDGYSGKPASEEDANRHLHNGDDNSSDTTAPTITLKGANPLTLEARQSFKDPGASAVDDRDGDVSVKVSGSVNSKKVGTYTLIYTASNSAGNKATKKRAIKVIDTTAPTISLKGDKTINISVGDSFSDPGVTTSDNADGEVKVKVTGSIDTGRAGSYSLIYTATDNAGNSATVKRVVNIIEGIAINGTPKTKTNIYNLYQFLPKVNKKNVSFSIKNKPLWADFNISTGLLQGIPSSDVNGTYKGIVISATSNGKTVSLAPFSIEVLPAIDIAHKFGKATQGTKEDYQYYEPAYYAIDNNDSTYNHTRGGANGGNWLQIELPNPTKVQKVVIQNRDGNANRLEGAKVYLSNTPYSGEVNETKLIATLQKTNDEQIITLNPPKSGTYLLIRGEQSSNDNKHIHLKKVEVYGTVPNTPLFEEAETNLLIPNSTAIGTKVATASAIDYQDDTLSYTILSDVPFSVNSNGDIAVDRELSNPGYTFDVEVSDGVNSTVKTITINVTSTNALEEALQSGEVDKITLAELLDGTLDKIESIKSYKDTLLRAIYQDNPISYDPGKSSQNIVELVNNDKAVALLSGSKYTLALGGEENDTRYLIFGSIPYNFFANGENLSYKPFLNRELLWLIGGLPINSDLNSSVKTIAYFSVSNEDNLKSYINSEFPKWNLKKCSDYSALNSCIEGSDLIIFEQKDKDNSQDIKEALDFAVAKHIPIAYFHPDWGKNDVAMAVAKRFNFVFPHGGNWWAKNKTDVDEYTLMVKNSELDQIKTVITHFENNDYSFDWSKCKDSKGNYGSENDDCSEVEGLKEEFINGATEVQKRLKNVDSKKIDLFKKEKFEFFKLLALVGDKIRQDVHYPMDKVTTDDNEFMKSLYSDYSIYNYREINPVQPDMGNFSRSDFSSITPITKTISMVSKTPLRAGGVYVLPGETVRVTRLDNNSSVHSYIFVNTLRSGATHEYGKNSGYRRPKFLHSQKIELKPEESIYFTSPYGGPLQIAFDQNGADVSFRVENVGQHPVWSEFDSNSNKDKDFADALDANEYDWAEIITSAFEVHSKRDLMLESINNFRWGSASKLSIATKTYASSHPMALAGFKGPGIETIDEIKDYSELKNIPIYNADFVKHMNADQAACGSGCSGNPYDAYWSFDPISHGDIHEIGHSLEKGIFRLKGWEGHSTTNIYAYYTQMKYNMYVNDNGLEDNYYIENGHVSVDVFKAQYSALQNCADSNDTVTCMKDYWKASNYAGQSLFTIQAMYQAQKYASGDYALSNGFHLVGRLHLLERYLAKDAKKDWENNKDDLGFSTYSLDEIKKIQSNNWLLISLSWATGVDYRPFFDMYGASYSQKASNQVESFSFSTTTKKEFFVVEKDSGFTLPYDKAGAYLDKQSVPIDGNTTYPYSDNNTNTNDKDENF